MESFIEFRDVDLRKTPVCCFSAIKDIADLHMCKIIDSLLMHCGKTKIKIWMSFHYAFRVCGFCSVLFCLACFLYQKGKMSLIYIIHILKSQWSEKAVNIILLTWLFGILIGALQMQSKDEHPGNLSENFNAESLSNWYMNTNIWIYESIKRIKSFLLRWILRR